ncbi:MAG TPA: thiol:disulfide interchange protein DsbA/DsbL [Cellvibrio sp.]|nr:thiol:disulfide interchange protein DsbA/DsbL [Cellvibrio sp.]
MRILVALSSILFSLSVFAADTAPATEAKTTFVQGKDYELLADPVRPLDPTKIEVVEVFAYTCPHCMHFEPLISAWGKKQQADVKVVQLHTKWSSQMEPYQRGFYTLLTLNLKDKVQTAVFDAVHGQRKDLSDAQAWADFLAPFGVDKNKVVSTYDSFGVTSQIKQADARVRAYRTAGTPELVVDGKYRISSSMTNNKQEGMLVVAQYLVDKIRAERAKP